VRIVSIISILFSFFTISASASPNAIPRFTVPYCLGVNIHFIEPRDNELDMIREAGFGLIRMDLIWEHVEKEKGVYDFGGYERLTKALHERGITPLYILDYSNKLYEQKRSVTTQEGREAFAKFAAAAVTALKSYPVVWEIWNEPNLKQFWDEQPSAEDYVALVEETVKAMRAVDANCTIIAPATSGIPLEFLDACFKKGMLQWLDAVSVHPYRSKVPETALEEYTTLREFIQRYGFGKTIPILSGEWGYSIHPYKGLPVDEHRQAQFIVRQFLTNFMADVKISIWYDWHDDGTDPNEREHNFGIVTHDFREKEAYKAAKLFNTQLRDLQFIKRYPTESADDYLALFGNLDRRMIVAWTTGEPHSCLFNLADIKIEGVTMFGDRIRLEKEDAAYIIPLSQDPIYIPFVK
jgi:hypothetical protein